MSKYGFQEIQPSGKQSLPYQVRVGRGVAETFKAGEYLLSGTAATLRSVTIKRISLGLAVVQTKEDAIKPGIVLSTSNRLEIEPFEDCQLLKGGAFCLPEQCYVFSQPITEKGAMIKVGKSGKWEFTDSEFLQAGEVEIFDWYTRALTINL